MHAVKEARYKREEHVGCCIIKKELMRIFGAKGIIFGNRTDLALEMQ